MYPEVLDMQILLPARFIFDQEPRVEQLLDQGLDVEIVVGEDLSLQLLGRTREPALIVCERPCADEE
jgi:hypothetical protein